VPHFHFHDTRHERTSSRDFPFVVKAPSGTGENGDCAWHDQATFGHRIDPREVPEFDAAAFSQELNKLGRVLEDERGFHIIRRTANESKRTEISPAHAGHHDNCVFHRRRGLSRRPPPLA
jgi:hypothetical protein